jgi:hypothetical protein
MTVTSSANISRIKQRNGIEVADIFRRHIGDYRKRYRMPAAHLQVVGDILNCRTAYLGGHVERCDNCRTEIISYNSCRNRHCPKCQCLTKERWLQARTAELLPVRYFHVVFTLPHDLNPLVLTNKSLMLNILFRAAADTLLVFGRNPDNGLGGQLGIIAVLHTWNQKLRDHFHLHCLVPAGALCDDKARWAHCRGDFLFPVKALSPVFRAKYLDEMRTVYAKGKLKFPGKTKMLGSQSGFKALVKGCYTHPWVVNIREPIDKPEYVLDYLGRYTHRVAISNNRIVALKNGYVTFYYKDRAANQKKQLRIDAVEFIRRFLLHVLPKGFMRIRHYGFLANRYKKENLKICRKLLGLDAELPTRVKESIRQVIQRLTGVDITRCPHCKEGTMMPVAQVAKGTGQNSFAILHPP